MPPIEEPMEASARNFINSIFDTLDGIETCPRMYGSPEAIEFQYEILLGVLAAGYGIEHRAVRDIVERVSASRVGPGADAFLHRRCLREEDLMDGLKEIRAKVGELIAKM